MCGWTWVGLKRVRVAGSWMPSWTRAQPVGGEVPSRPVRPHRRSSLVYRRAAAGHAGPGRSAQGLTDGAWIEGPTLDWEVLPARVEAVIEERIDRLDPELQISSPSPVWRENCSQPRLWLKCRTCQKDRCPAPAVTGFGAAAQVGERTRRGLYRPETDVPLPVWPYPLSGLSLQAALPGGATAVARGCRRSSGRSFTKDS